MKNFKRTIAIIMALILMMFAFAACGGNSGITGGTTPVVNNEDAKAVADYVEILKESYEASSTNEMGSGKCYANGTDIVCTYTYNQEVPDGTDKALQEIMNGDEFASTFETLVETARTEVPALTSIIVEYYSVDGKLLATRTFK